jgi:hypothetical protein
MSETKHTLEPWRVHSYGPDEPTWILGPEPGTIFVARMGSTMGCNDASREEEKVNACRIVACVNALDGIEDPAEWVRDAMESITQLELVERAGRV